MKKEQIKLSRPNKILLVMYDLSNKKKKALRFEDIVVALFKQYKEDFHMRGYPQYPDSEGVGKELYRNQKRDGLVEYGNKVFSLTEKGLSFAKELKRGLSNRSIVSPTRLSRYVESEVFRIEKLDGYKLFLKGETDKIFDTDFYNYLGVSVRTEKAEIQGRFKILEDVSNELKKKNGDKTFHDILKYHDFMLKKFRDTVNYYIENQKHV